MNKKRALLLCLFFFLPAGIAFSQNTSMKQEVRKVLYAVEPVKTVRNIGDDMLKNFYLYAGGLPKSDGPLNAVDQTLALVLFGLEMRRRSMSPDDFSLNLQEEHESLEKFIKNGGDTRHDAAPFIKADSWVSLFKLNLVLEQ